MPDVVLRHPNLPNQPIVIPGSPDGKVSAAYKAAGWEIDTKTDPGEALLEAPKAKRASTVKPSFEEPSSDDQPAEPASEPNKEN